MDANINRVYVNPNFNRISNVASLVSNPTYMNNYMHVNPNFTQHMPNVQQNPNFNRKIFVNPNFIKSNKISPTNQYSGNNFELYYNNKITEDPIYSNNDNFGMSPPKTENSKPLINILPHPTSKSKYHLIRKTNNKCLENEHKVKETSTIKISKYKSIPINNFKNNLQIVKHDNTSKQTLSCNNCGIPAHKCVNRSSFKLIRHNVTPTINRSPKPTLKANLLKIKRNIDLSVQTKLKISNGSKKKNNIPCRLFTKYGKCIRNSSGTCQYLHDKKHVSLCRRFLKGICHDKNCLLSHELSSKKMPTCFFYLKGMCMKSECPYLHVKLSEKSKVCLDFLKGYCDKGDMCVYRHVRPNSNKSLVNKRLDNTRTKNKTNRIVKINTFKLVKSNQFKRLNTKIEQNNVEERISAHCTKNEQEKTDVDCRYFREDIQSEDVMCENLKPTRCKLGTLPSFIQL